MNRKSWLLASVVAAVMAATTGYSMAAGPGKGGGGPGMGQRGPAAQAEGAAGTEQPQYQYKHRKRVGEQDSGKKVRAEGGKAGREASSVAPMEIAPAE